MPNVLLGLNYVQYPKPAVGLIVAVGSIAFNENMADITPAAMPP